MFWIEMSKNEAHGGGEWGFSKCIWAPAYKNGTKKGSWLFWRNILEVKQGGYHIAFARARTFSSFCRIFHGSY